MNEQLYLTHLYDYYKELLTERQRSFFEDYYFDNLIMEEIAENNHISKNAVSKQLMDAKEKLLGYEQVLHLYANFEKISLILDEEELNKILDYI